MTYTREFRLLVLLVYVTGCITVNVYFPAAAAEQAADRIIKEVYGEKLEKMPPATPAQPDDQSSYETLPEQGVASRLLEFLVPVAQAQEANMDISTPAINKFKASMTQRHN